MVWNKLSFKLFIYLVLLSLIGFGIFWSVFSNQLIITNIVFVFFFVLSFYLLLKYLNKTNRDLNQFLKSINYLDNLPLKTTTDLSHGQLNVTYNKIIDQLRDAWLAKEMEHQYFKFILEQVGVGIITYNSDGEIEIYNKAAKVIFGIDVLNHISQLDKIKPGLKNELDDIKPEGSRLIELDGAIENIKILVKVTEIKIQQRRLRLLSFQNIKTQLEESELEAWQKLIRVLTHEIMNSVTPIKSLTYSMQKALSTEQDQSLENLSKGLKAIETRSKGLLDFVDSYKNLTQIPKPNYERVAVKDLFSDLGELFKDEFTDNNIQFTSEVFPEDISLIGDKKLISQVVINLVKNSIYALESKSVKELKLISGISADNKVFIEVYDSGKGIPDEVKDKIFIPFYTTRLNGSGIGLSFARQVMVMHNGTIEVKSKLNEFTSFKLIF